MKANDYKVLSMAVEAGIKYGLNRAYKYEDTPGLETIEDAIHAAVMNEIAEWFEWEDRFDG